MPPEPGERMYERSVKAFVKRHQTVIAALALALVSLHLALTDQRAIERGYVAKRVISVFAMPVQKAAVSAREAVGNAWSGYVDLVGVREENDALRRTLASLAEENNRLREDVLLNSRLKEIVGYREASGIRTTAGSILALNLDRWTRTAVIDKGSNDGVAKDMAVISPAGVIGRIIEARGATSTVLLGSDLRSNIDAVSQRSRVKGVIEGNGTDGLILKYIRQVDDVQVGDVIITSGLAGIFPKGIVIGEVIRVEKGMDNFFKVVEVRQKVDLRTAEEVLVVTDGGLRP